MSENEQHTRTNDADQNGETAPERINDPQAGLSRLRQALARILKVPKDAIAEDAAK